MQNPNNPPNTRNLMIAIGLGLIIMAGWQHFYVQPYQQRQQAYVKQKEAEYSKAHPVAPDTTSTADGINSSMKRETVLQGEQTTRLPINSDRLHGSIALTGSRFDDLTLPEYRETLDPKSPEVVLLSPQKTPESYYAEFGWLPGDSATAVPDAKTNWSADSKTLNPDAPVTLHWNSPQGLTFAKKISLDKEYLFTLDMAVTNHSSQPVTLYPYGRIQRNFDDNHKHSAIMHEGPLGVFNNTLNDVKYKDLREKDGAQEFSSQSGWLGFTDKYWLTAMVPDNTHPFKATMKYVKPVEGADSTSGTYQVDYRADAVTIAPGETVTLTNRLFAGAKKVSVLDDYRLRLGFPLFDRAVDFGSLYFLTKPIFVTLDFLYGIVGNFGIAILMLTVIIKTLMFPLANKSFVAMSQMKVLGPKIKELQERHKDDKMKMNTELMNLYKSEKVHPMSGCFPILIQIPVFFSLYKVLSVTIEMRHAPFFAWVHDLSAPDPTNLFTLFGAIDWNVPSMLHLGILPIVMCATMVMQQRLNPKPTDPIQAQMITFMPFIFLFMFAKFPAGLVLYYAWNNSLSIIQQRLILHRIERKKKLTGHVS